jgi:hypothetical protein
MAVKYAPTILHSFILIDETIGSYFKILPLYLFEQIVQKLLEPILVKVPLFLVISFSQFEFLIDQKIFFKQF